jgi:hypothetical protein
MLLQVNNCSVKTQDISREVEDTQTFGRLRQIKHPIAAPSRHRPPSQILGHRGKTTLHLPFPYALREYNALNLFQHATMSLYRYP